MSTRHRGHTPRLIRPMIDFMRTESAGGVFLIAAALVGLVWANSPWRGGFESLWSTNFSIDIGGHGISMDLRHWLNDGLMTLFFLLVGLEIKRELVEGELADRRQAALPAIAALGGMVIPAGIFLLITAGSAEQSGWGIPMATDIALALGVLSLFGSRVPSSAKVFLLALAIVDDIGAIIVIGIFYSKGFSLLPFVLGVAAVLSALVLRRLSIYATWVFAIVGAVAWVLIHESGVHATLVGVVMGLMAPVDPRIPESLIDAEELADVSTVDAAIESAQLARASVSTVEWVEHKLHPWTSFGVVPLFALANMGVEISGSTLHDAVTSKASWGIIVGLVIGKPLGVIAAVTLGVRAFGLSLPDGVSMRMISALGALAGIGFTVSLFITELAFDDHDLVSGAKLAILVASAVAAVIGVGLVRASAAKPDEPEADVAVAS